MLITYKQQLRENAPFTTSEGNQYLELLKKNESAIYQGTLGVYLSRKVLINDQELCQSFIDIDAVPGLEGHDKIASAIKFARLTAKTFENYGILDHFRFIATGGTGFRALSNFLLNRPAYFAFVDWMRDEMPHIHDLKPSREIDFPHQVFGYKGDVLHNDKELTDSHSVVIDKNMLLQGVYTVDDYLQATAGKPDPREIISFVQWLLAGTVISDLSALGNLGRRLEEYERVDNDFKLYPFNYLKLRKDKQQIGLERMQQMLRDKGMLSKIQDRKGLVISFQGLPCPMCGDPKANARARPPYYQLKCFNTDCEARRGVPLHRWAGIKDIGGSYQTRKKGYDLSFPAKHDDLIAARNLINAEFTNADDSLLVVTPGVGKTHAAVDIISKMGEGKVIIYAACNTALQGEAYSKICDLAGHSNGFHLIKARDQTCKKSGELKDVTNRGFSPSEILCNSCDYRESNCEYYQQREELGPGVYFVTLHMLQYLEDKFSKPDLIILDENLKAGLLLKDTSTDTQIKSLLKVLEGTDVTFIKQFLDIIQRISVKVVENKWREEIFNGRKLTDADENTIIELMSKCTGRPEEEIHSTLASLVKALEKLPRKLLYLKGIDMSAIAWIKGLSSREDLSYVHINGKGEVSYCRKRITPLGYHGTPVKILDATGDASAIEPLVGRKLKTVRADVEWKSNRVHIKKSLSRKDMALTSGGDLKKLLTEMLLHTQAQKIMVITYKPQKDQVVRILKAIDPTRNFMGFHFFGPRGINRYQNCDAVLVIGLPYSNLNSAAQDACLLFPNERDVDKRIDWAEANMHWEFVQAIHRIRPIHKRNIDLVLAASNWPSSLVKPNVVIDQSLNANWRELAVKRLEPFVEEFGFLNQDIGFLANVFVKVDSKEGIARRFQGILSKLITDRSTNSSGEISKFSTSVFMLKGNKYISMDISHKNKEHVQENVEEKRKLISVINNILTVIYLQRIQQNDLLDTLCIKGQCEWIYNEIKISNTTQWTDLLIGFKEKNPHFEKFKIKLPHSQGNSVIGVGSPERVKEFYKQINDLGIVGKVNIDSYQVIDQSVCSIDPVPEGFVSVYLPDDEDFAYVAWGTEFSSLSLGNEPSSLKTIFEGIVTDCHTKIITNNGKKFAKVFLACESTRCEIIDVVITEKLLANGEVPFQAINLKTIFKRHEFPEGMEKSIVTRKLFGVWEKQEMLIQERGLEQIFDIESRLIWVTAKIEEAGIGIDADRLLSLHDAIKEKMLETSDEVAGMIPEGFSLDDESKILEHLNSAYGLSLAKINEKTIKRIPEFFAKYIAIKQLEYSGLSKILGQIGSCMGSIDPDDRYHDEINQLNTRTGRFYRALQKVSKPIRSLFRAEKGYKLIKADYSQEEPRIMAALSGDQAAIELFKAGKDIYLETARIIFGDVEHLRNYREIGKGFVIGLINGESPWGICGRLNKMGFYYDPDQVSFWVSLFYDRFPAVSAWITETVDKVKQTGIGTTKLGRLRKFSAEEKDNQMSNHPIQGAAADGFKLALIDLDEKLAGFDAKIVHIMHDEIIVEAREWVADEVAIIMKECMEGTFAEIFPEVPFVVNPEIRDTWA